MASAKRVWNALAALPPSPMVRLYFSGLESGPEVEAASAAGPSAWRLPARPNHTDAAAAPTGVTSDVAAVGLAAIKAAVRTFCGTTHRLNASQCEAASRAAMSYVASGLGATADPVNEDGGAQPASTMGPPALTPLLEHNALGGAAATDDSSSNGEGSNSSCCDSFTGTDSSGGSVVDGGSVSPSPPPLLKAEIVLVQGPPGSGKTSTIVAMASVLSGLALPSQALLVCAPTNAAVGEAAARFATLIQATGSQKQFAAQTEARSLQDRGEWKVAPPLLPGDCLLVANEHRLDLSRQPQLESLYLDHRASRLMGALGGSNGWYATARKLRAVVGNLAGECLNPDGRPDLSANILAYAVELLSNAVRAGKTLLDDLPSAAWALPCGPPGCGSTGGSYGGDWQPVKRQAFKALLDECEALQRWGSQMLNGGSADGAAGADCSLTREVVERLREVAAGLDCCRGLPELPGLRIMEWHAKTTERNLLSALWGPDGWFPTVAGLNRLTTPALAEGGAAGMPDLPRFPPDSFKEHLIKVFGRLIELGNNLRTGLPDYVWVGHGPGAAASTDNASRVRGTMEALIKALHAAERDVVAADATQVHAAFLSHGAKAAAAAASSGASSGGGSLDFQVIALRLAARNMWSKLERAEQVLEMRSVLTMDALQTFCADQARVVFSTISAAAKTVVLESRLAVGACIVDEAAQTTEADLAIVLQHSKQMRLLALVGDPQQLAATVKSRLAGSLGYGRSPFERLQQYGWQPVLLNTQYRMHPFISSFPRLEFYRQKLNDGDNVKGPEYEGMAALLDLPRGRPYTVVNVSSGCEERDAKSDSLGNQREAEIAVRIVRRVLTAVQSLRQGSSGDVAEPNFGPALRELQRPERTLSIGVITPYGRQEEILNERLNEIANSDPTISIAVGTVDAFQGQEKDVIILSTVRANVEADVGFLDDRRRLNVALTRARHALVVLMRAGTLRGNKSWKDLLDDAERRGVLVSESVFNKEPTELWEVDIKEGAQKKYESWCKERKALVDTAIKKLKEGHFARLVRSNRVKQQYRHLIHVQYLDECNVALLWGIKLKMGEKGWTQAVQVWDVLLNERGISQTLQRIEGEYDTYTEEYINNLECSPDMKGVVLPRTYAMELPFKIYRPQEPAQHERRQHGQKQGQKRRGHGRGQQRRGRRQGKSSQPRK